MRKSKLMKALLVFGMSVVTATSMVGIAACNPDSGNGDDNGNGNGHQHSYDGWNTSKTEHWHECLECSEEADRGNHVDVKNNKTDAAGADNYCDVCGYELAHTFADTWSKDASGHWHAAICDHTSEIDELLPHVDADKNNVCDECEFVGAVADGYTALAEKAGATTIVADTFFAQDTKINTAFTSFGANGMYARPEKPDATVETNYIQVSGGSAVHVTNGAINTGLVVDFGGALTGVVVEGYADITPSATGNDWSVLKFFNGENCDDANRILALHTKDSSGTLAYSLKDKSVKYDAQESITLSAGTTAQVYYKLDLTSGRVTLKVNDKVIVEDFDAGVNSVTGYEIISSNKGLRLVTIDNLITVTSEATVDGYRDALKLNVNEIDAQLPAEVKTSTATAKGTVLSALDDATTKEACTEAYNTYYSAVINAYKDYVSAQITNNYAGKYTTVGKNKEQYEAAKTTLENVINAADLKIEDAISAYGTFVSTVAELYTDTEWAQVFDVTISNGTTTVGTLANILPTHEITKDELDEAINLDTVNKKATYHTESVSGAEVQFPLTLNAATTIYVVVEDIALKNVDFKAIDMTAETWTSEKVLVEGAISVTASSSASVTVDTSAKAIGIDDSEAELKSTHRIKLGGTGKADSRSIKLIVRAKAKITILAMSSSKDTDTTDNSRTVKWYDADFNDLASQTGIHGNSNPLKIEYTANEAGTYYFASTTGGLNVYRIIIEYIA